MDAKNESRELLELIACLGRLHQGELRQRAGSTELQPVHLQSLLFLREANRYSNTPHALAEYLGSTKGTVSQSLLLLYRKGLVERHADEHDGRVVRLRLSRRGAAMLNAAQPAPQWQAATAGLGAGEIKAAVAVLTRLLRALQYQRGGRSFGVCHTCKLFCRDTPSSFRCGLTDEALSRGDSLKICRVHAPASAE